MLVVTRNVLRGQPCNLPVYWSVCQTRVRRLHTETFHTAPRSFSCRSISALLRLLFKSAQRHRLSICGSWWLPPSWSLFFWLLLSERLSRENLKLNFTFNLCSRSLNFHFSCQFILFNVLFGSFLSRHGWYELNPPSQCMQCDAKHTFSRISWETLWTI